VIICNAGGQSFRPEEAAEIRRRGILLIGVTLSDPDVFASVAPAAASFDYHTTNARQALSMYREAGVRNTMWLPFGIDRDYILADVPDAPELHADVICLGHAKGRPERNETMRRVAERHDVRVYGTGWELPGAEVVRDERQMQAARAGRIHVNFAVTRAAYVNVKCGVFEAVGAGGVVCTSRFEEMERFFAYGREIVEFGDADDLVNVLDGLLADPARLEQIRRAAFQRLITEHLYEHRWLKLFEDIERDLAGEGEEILTRERAAIVAETLAADGRPPRRVVISGFYGARNLGDDLLLQSIADGIKERSDGPVQITVAAHNAERVRELGFDAFTRHDVSAGRDAIRDGSAIVLGGGGLWHDHTFEKAGGLPGWFEGARISVTGLGTLPVMAKVLGRQFHVFGMGVGPLADPEAQALVRYLAEQADTIQVRDDTSAELLGEISGGTLDVRVMPDPVYGLRLPERRLPDAVRRLRAGWRLVAVNLRPWPQAEEDGTYAAVAQALERLAVAGDVAFVGVPMQAGDRVDDAAIRAVLDQLGTSVPTFVLPSDSPVEEVLGTLEAVDVAISMRLHASLLAHRFSVPAVGIAYDPKVTEHFAQLGLTRRCLPLTAGAEQIHHAAEAALALGGVVEPDVAAKVRELTAAAAAAYDLLAERLDSAPAVPLPEDGRDWLAPPPADAAA
jgi:polysaccharide pyruvyl transferase CsaB